MKQELDALDKLIIETLDPRKLSRAHLTLEFIAESKWIARSELRKIKDHLDIEIIRISDPAQVELCVRRQQYFLTELSDHLFRYSEESDQLPFELIKTSEPFLLWYRQLSMLFENCLDDLERQYSRYFDHDMKITEGKREVLCSQGRARLKIIQKGFRKAGISEGLVHIVCTPYQDVFNPERIINYQNVFYLEKFYKGLSGFLAEPVSDKSNDRLYEHLVYLNFNSLRYFNFVISDFQEKAGRHENPLEQIELFYRAMTRLNQLTMKQNICLKPSLPSIKEQIGTWLSEEIFFLDKRMKLSGMHLKPAADFIGEEKIHTSLSVAHLSLAVKLLVEAKVIKNRNSTELMRIVARNFKTNRNEELSENSLRNKFYTVETGTLSYMKDLMGNLLKLIRQYGG